MASVFAYCSQLKLCHPREAHPLNHWHYPELNFYRAQDRLAAALVLLKYPASVLCQQMLLSRSDWMCKVIRTPCASIDPNMEVWDDKPHLPEDRYLDV
jgi:hypothetical protein